MGWMRDTVALYARVFRRGGELTGRNLLVGLVVILYQVLLALGGMLAAPLGLVGGILLYVLTVACLSSELFLVEQVIRSGRARLTDLPGSFAAYLGDLLAVFFMIWLLTFVASLLFQGSFLAIVFTLAMVTFFNAVPELIYLGRHTAAEILVESYRFIGENWIEWFPPNAVLLACLVGVGALDVGPLDVGVVPAGPFGVIEAAVSGVVLFFAMVVRGLLFLELTTSSRRAREFRRRAAG
jgi:hypothetical protein